MTTLETSLIHIWNLPEIPCISFKHPWNTLQISFELSWNTPKTFFKHCWNFLETSWRLPWNTIETSLTPVKILLNTLLSYLNTLGTFFKHLWKFCETSLKHSWNFFETTLILKPPCNFQLKPSNLPWKKLNNHQWLGPSGWNSLDLLNTRIHCCVVSFSLPVL